MNDEIKGYKLADGSDSTDYKIGDTFEVVENVESCSSTKVGNIITLTEDDNSNHPFFDQIEGVIDYKCCCWSELKPTPETILAVFERKGGIIPEEHTPTPRQILEQAFTEILDKHGIIIDELGVDWMNISTTGEVNYIVNHITIKGDCAK